mmetsp:Transcript_28781/g.63426  ORF Transcript_28781/g.63426 Transcript_28781/m.63426 type:complete len:105 (+) Transcript_28781:299-613(+)
MYSNNVSTLATRVPCNNECKYTTHSAPTSTAGQEVAPISKHGRQAYYMASTAPHGCGGGAATAFCLHVPGTPAVDSRGCPPAAAAAAAVVVVVVEAVAVGLGPP